MKELLDILSERKLTRIELAIYLGVPDRQARKVIEKLQSEDDLIVNDGKGEGYFKAKTKLEASTYINEYYAHFRTMGATLEKMLIAYNKLE